MYGPGRWIAGKLGNALFAFEVLAAAHLTVATTGLRYFDSLYPGAWWPGFGLLGLLVLQYAKQALTVTEREEKDAAKEAERIARADEIAAREKIRTAEIDILRRHIRSNAGNLSRLLKALVEDKVRSDTQALRVAFLSHAVLVVKECLGVDKNDDRITATWAVPVSNFTQWVVAAYDRNQADRQPGRRRDIAPGIPGASDAFLSGKSVFLEDTLDPRYVQYFEHNPPYRSILSIPARSMSVSSGKNTDINGEPNTVTGVLNIDCRETGVLSEDTVRVVADIAYLLGVLEQLGG